MEISLPDNVRQQSIAAGYASVEQYILSLMKRDRERLAIEVSLTALREGRVREFDEFDQEFRQRNNLTR